MSRQRLAATAALIPQRGRPGHWRSWLASGAGREAAGPAVQGFRPRAAVALDFGRLSDSPETGMPDDRAGGDLDRGLCPRGRTWLAVRGQVDVEASGHGAEGIVRVHRP
jgi:hypothetical protein